MKKFLLSPKGFEYNDEVYSEQGLETPVGLFSSRDAAVAAAKQAVLKQIRLIPNDLRYIAEIIITNEFDDPYDSGEFDLDEWLNRHSIPFTKTPDKTYQWSSRDLYDLDPILLADHVWSYFYVITELEEQ